MMTSDEYLAHCYAIPETLPDLPLADEAFIATWKAAEGKAVREFLAETMGRDVAAFSLQKEEAVRIFLMETLGGRLPVIVTGCHEDFRSMEAILSGRSESEAIPLTVNAFTLQVRADITTHRVILLGWAPYSNVPAKTLGVEEDEWMEQSYRLRLAHECTHYETLRLFGNMQNHALDEIVADAIGQLTAFGSFSAERQRLFFGLEHGADCCTGRLSFYCRAVFPWEKTVVYRSVDMILNSLRDEITLFLAEKAKTVVMSSKAASVQGLLSDKSIKYELLSALAGTSIAERINNGWI